MICNECQSEKQPAALLLGTTPGWSCKCQWETLTKQEFKQIFGYGFRRVTLPNVAMGGNYQGNSRQRRIARRITLRELEAARSRRNTTSL